MIARKNRSKHSPIAMALALAPGTLLAGVAGGIAFPILPVLGVRLGLSLTVIGAILATNRAVRVVVNPLVGAIADRFGGRRTLLAGLVIQIGVMALYAIGATSHHVALFFFAGRMLHGLGSSCVFVAAQALALHAGEGEYSGSTAGTVRTAMVLGVPIGLSIGGLLSDRFGDVAAFEIAGGGVCVAAVAAFFLVPDLRVDLRGKGRVPLRRALAAASDRRLLVVGALNFAMTFAAGGMVITTLALLVLERHLSLFGRNAQATSGLFMGFMTIIDAGVTPFAGHLGDKLRAHARVAAAGVVLLVPGLVIVGLARDASALFFGLALIGLGTAGLGPSLLALVGALVPAERRGMGVGLLQLSGDIGGTMGPLVGTALLANDTRLPYFVTAGIVAAFVPLSLWLTRVATENDRKSSRKIE